MLNKSEFNFLTFEPLIPLNFPEKKSIRTSKSVKKSFSCEIYTWWPIVHCLDPKLFWTQNFLKAKIDFCGKILFTQHYFTFRDTCL